MSHLILFRESSCLYCFVVNNVVLLILFRGLVMFRILIKLYSVLIYFFIVFIVFFFTIIVIIIIFLFSISIGPKAQA